MRLRWVPPPDKLGTREAAAAILHRFPETG